MSYHPEFDFIERRCFYSPRSPHWNSIVDWDGVTNNIVLTKTTATFPVLTFCGHRSTDHGFFSLFVWGKMLLIHKDEYNEVL